MVSLQPLLTIFFLVIDKWETNLLGIDTPFVPQPKLGIGIKADSAGIGILASDQPGTGAFRCRSSSGIGFFFIPVLEWPVRQSGISKKRFSYIANQEQIL